MRIKKSTCIGLFFLVLQFAVASLFADAPSGALMSENLSAKALGSELQMPFSPQLLSVQIGAGPDAVPALYLSASGGIIEVKLGRKRWLKVPESSAVFVTAFDASGRLFAGATGDFGYFDQLESSAPRWRSLRMLLPTSDADRPVRALWRCGAAMYFDLSGSGLYRYQKRIEKLNTRSGYRGLSTANGCWLYGAGKGLTHVDETSSEVVRQGNAAQGVKLDQLQVNSLALIDSDRAWLFAREGVFALSGLRKGTVQLTRLQAASALFDADQSPVQAITLADAVGKVHSIVAGGSRGIARFDVHDAACAAKRWIGAAEGVEGTIYGMAVNAQNALWVSTGTALTRVELDSLVERFDLAHGLRGSPTSLSIFQQHALVSSSEGLFLLQASSDGPCAVAPAQLQARFRPLLNASEFVYYAVESGGTLYFATRNALQRLTPSAVSGEFHRATVLPNTTVLSIAPPNTDLPLFVLGTAQGVSMMAISKEPKDAHWQEVARVALGADIRSILHAGPGELWLGSEASGSFRLRYRYTQQHWTTLDVQRFDASVGLPRGITVPLKIAGRVLIATSAGLFDPDNVSASPVINTSAARPLWPELGAIYSALELGPGWLLAGDRIQFLRRQGGTWARAAHALNRIPLGTSVVALHRTHDQLWTLTDHGLYRHALDAGSNIPAPTAVALSLYAQTQNTTLALPATIKPKAFAIRTAPAALRFEFSSDSDRLLPSLEYRAQLLGAELQMSNWSHEHSRSYSSLLEGNYQLRVQVRDDFAQESHWLELPIRIHAPWWRTTWAYALWLLSLIAAFSFWLRWRAQRERSAREALEALVAVKTSELQTLAANRARLLHDLSHELRSPLARLRLHLELMRMRWLAHPPARTAGSEHDAIEPRLARADHEIGRMDVLVDELLTLSRLEHEPTLADQQTFSLHALINDCVDSAKVEAEVAGNCIHIDLRCQIQLCGHQELLARAIDNLLRNAIRHTPAGSVVDVRLELNRDAIELSILDRGPGVPEALLDRIFDAFFRAPDANAQRGYGLGLTLARRVAFFHQATLVAENRTDGGLCMRMRFAAIARLGSSTGDISLNRAMK
jgi:signal transduction histidine kinase